MWRNVPWFRLLISGLLLASAHKNAVVGLAAKDQYEAVFGAVLCLVLACILLASTMIRQAALPLTGLIDRIYFGDNRQDDVPPVNLRLPCAYRAERCYQKAVDECERQLQWHSLVPELWAELLLASRAGRHMTGAADAAVRLRALECLGMMDRPERFDKIVRDRDNLPPHPLYLASQFDR